MDYGNRQKCFTSVLPREIKKEVIRNKKSRNAAAFKKYPGRDLNPHSREATGF
jgi:hypothetical protein